MANTTPDRYTETMRAVEYTRRTVGDATADVMLRYLNDGQRIGQAFFNALPGYSQDRLRGTLADPFYRDTVESVVHAVDFLTAPR